MNRTNNTVSPTLTFIFYNNKAYLALLDCSSSVAVSHSKADVPPEEDLCCSLLSTYCRDLSRCEDCN
jgi:hypothetical protein